MPKKRMLTKTKQLRALMYQKDALKDEEKNLNQSRSCYIQLFSFFVYVSLLYFRERNSSN